MNILKKGSLEQISTNVIYKHEYHTLVNKDCKYNADRLLFERFGPNGLRPSENKRGIQ